MLSWTEFEEWQPNNKQEKLIGVRIYDNNQAVNQVVQLSLQVTSRAAACARSAGAARSSWNCRKLARSSFSGFVPSHLARTR